MKNILNTIFNNKQELSVKEPLPEAFVTIPCDCGESIELFQRILPGQAAILECENCDLSWTIYNPSLIVKKTRELPENMQEIWRELEKV